jgi:hypothetical protein
MSRAAWRARIRLTAGGSAYLGFVFAPYKEIRINNLTNEMVSSYYLEPGVVVIPVANVGKNPATFATGKMRLGFGFIWGEINQGSDFTGMMAGISSGAFIFKIRR